MNALSSAPETASVPASAHELSEISAELLGRIRAKQPLVHAITNHVVQGFTANVLLALGASPAMVDIVGEAGIFAGVADGLLVNLGTIAPGQGDAMFEAVQGANAAGTPWVLDPVAIGVLPIRTQLAADLLEYRPAAIRGNASEVMALAGLGAGGRGTDAEVGPEVALPAARLLAARGSIVAVSGAEDQVTSAAGTVLVPGGSALLTKVTGGGCALGAVVAAFLGVRGEYHEADAVAAAHAVYSLAAARAAARAGGPGSFATLLLDELAAVDTDSVRRECQFAWLPDVVEAGATA